MKNKGLSVLISLFAVLILSVSFSVSVFASSFEIKDSSSFDLVLDELSEDIISDSDSFVVGNMHRVSEFGKSYSLDVFDNLVDDALYKVNLSISGSFTFTEAFYLRNCAISIGNDVFYFSAFPFDGDWVAKQQFPILISNGEFYIKGSDLNTNSLGINFYILGEVNSSDMYSGSYSLDLDFNVNNIVELSSSDSDSYEEGYNAGYSAGEEAGYTSGYSSGFQAGADSIDQDAIYDQGYQAGVDSVDTQSYYDAGYQAGYAAAYDAGYSSGYNVGYDDAMAAIESWGADGNIYPSLIFDWTRNSEFTVSCNARSQYPGTAFGSIGLYNGFDLADPNHVYKVEFNFVDQGIDFDDYSYSGFKRVFMIGDKEFAFTGNDGSFFIDGNDFSSDFLIGVYAYYARASSTDTPYGGCQFGFDDFNVMIYDYGFKDNMQNIIANQTNDLTTGYDAGSITESNTSLSGSLTQYDQAEAEITGQSVGFIDGVEFYDPSSNAQLLTCITFCSSFLQSLFVNLGDWGILPMISLSLALGLMLVGWFKYRK